MLQAVAQFIANSADSAPVSMIADQAHQRRAARSTMQEAPEGYTYLRLETAF